jgi:predicted Zn-dependent peptidase
VQQGLFAIEQVGGFSGKTVALANGQVIAGDPRFFRSNLLEYGDVTPQAVTSAMGRWLTRPVYSLRVDPGTREAYTEASASRQAPPDTTPPTSSAREAMPPIGEIADLDFPNVERARLSNGIEIVYAQRTAIPVTLVALDFNAGIAADPRDRFGAQRLMLSVMTAGANGRDAMEIAEQQERLGANVTAFGSMDRSTVFLTALTANLGLSLDLFSDIVIRPDFEAGEVERLRNAQLALVAQEATQPNGLAGRVFPTLVFGENHPYGRAASGLGSQGSVGALDREALVNFHRTWIRPETARMFVVSDRPLRELRPLLERRFGAWRGDANVAVGRKDFTVAIPEARTRIVIVDRPQSPQSVIYAGQVTALRGGQDDPLTLNAANEAIGGGFLSRINTEIRERRGWSYGLGGNVALREFNSPYIVNAPVQADRTGESIQVLIQQFRDFRSTSGVTEAEHTRIINGNIRQLPGSFETAASIIGALRGNALYNRPDNYWERVASRYRGMTAGDMDAAARAAIDPDKFVWVVVGDASVVRPQLERLGLPIETVTVTP